MLTIFTRRCFLPGRCATLAITIVSLLELYSGQTLAATGTDWYAGKEYWRQLDLPVGLEWSAHPLRSALSDLARSRRICIWLDRRVDPAREVRFSSEGDSLDRTLKRLAGNLGLGVGYFESLVYVGPPQTASVLATVAAMRTEEAAKLPLPPREAALLRRAWQWEELATPRGLLQGLASEGQFSIANLEVVPHDLWPAGDLPPLTLVERLSLVLAGFDLSFTWDGDGRRIQLIPLPRSAAVGRMYAPRGEADRAVQELARVFPHVQVKRVGARVAVSGSFEDHVRIDRWLRGERVAVAGETRYTLKIENQPLGAVLSAVARRLGYELDANPALEAELQQLISFRLENATADELLHAPLHGRPLRLSIDGKKLKVLPAN